jgi:hypothetical protein
MAITAPATSSTLAVADGKTLTANKTLTLTGTDGTTQTFPTTSATIARTDAAQTFTGIQTVERILSSTGILSAVPTATATTFITLPQNVTTYGINIYLVSIGCIANSASNYSAVAIVKICYNTCQVTIISSGVLVNITNVGLVIKATQTSGANQDIEWTVTQIG